MKNYKELDIIIPISIELDWPTKESIVADIIEQNEKYGFTRFALAAPSAGWRSVGYPTIEHFKEKAELFLEVKNELEPLGIECGWWITATIKSGVLNESCRIVKSDGSLAPFSNCPSAPDFIERFSKDVALFAEIAKPKFIITEDDYSIYASTLKYGCFCENHLAEFSKRIGRSYTREELVKLFDSKSEEAIRLLKIWQEVMKDSLVILAKRMRQELDKKTPEIPMGYMQSGCSDLDGDCTLEIARAMAGDKHTPFSRIFGTFYGGFEPHKIPEVLYHPIYSRQHIEGDFRFYHESDTFPHTRFFTSGAEMRAIMGAVYSCGFCGSTFQTQQLLDCPNEETAYGSYFAKERKRFNVLYNTVTTCELEGVEISFDSFFSTIDGVKQFSDWTLAVSLFGIPYTTKSASVAFWDKSMAAYADEETVLEYLSKTLFLDGEAAKILCNRGFGEYIGVSVGEDIADEGMLKYDLGAREVICEAFATDGYGKNMPCAHMLARGNGKMLRLFNLDDDCEIITEAYAFRKNKISPAMTRFTNKLGGKITVMAITLNGNFSQSLFNYRRQRLLHRLINDCSDEICYVKEAARVYVIMNKAKSDADFIGLLTLTNLSSDSLDYAELKLSSEFNKFSKILSLNIEGEWEEINYEKTDDGIKLLEKLEYLNPLYLKFE